MIIFSFDCAICNLGFCCIEINENWRSDVAKLINQIDAFYTSDSSDNMLDIMEDLIKKANTIIDSMFVIKYMNIFDLVPEGKAKSIKYSEVLKRIKYVMYCLQKQLPCPDVVLIEYQMNVNDKARGISRYIEEYFMPMGDNINITYALPKYPLEILEIPEEYFRNTSVVYVAPALKNAYQTDSSVAGAYSTFMLKYNSNYSANKAHSTWNFKHFVKTFGLSDNILNVHNKLDDVADAFMQAFAWAKKNKVI